VGVQCTDHHIRFCIIVVGQINSGFGKVANEENGMTWIDVASDAVKIGLGALIGASATLLNAQLAHNNRKSEEYTKRRRDSLESIMPEFNELFLDAMSEISALAQAFNGVETDVVKINTEIYNYLERSKEIGLRNGQFNIIISKVALLGYQELADQIDELRDEATSLPMMEKSSGQDVFQRFQALHDEGESIIITFAEVYKSA
jgi:hypothetical protein